MIEDVTAALRAMGVDAARIHSEHFAATAANSTVTAEATAATTDSATSATRVDLIMDGRRRSFTMLTREETILDAAARAGIDLPFSCKAGVCSTCRTKLTKGKVALDQNYALEDWELEQGFILACQAHAQTPELELNYDET
jgi:ring-1,2-phenylacetyl-CoA epoxidase subunit PaaE